MQIETKYFGAIEINQTEIIKFPQGLPGFLDEKQFVLLNMEENGAFQVLQSITQAPIAFIVVNPFIFLTDYQIDLADSILDQLDIKQEHEVMVRTIVTLKEPLAKSTANLQAPVVINQANNRAKQYITKNTHYTPREAIFQTNTAEGVE